MSYVVTNGVNYVKQSKSSNWGLTTELAKATKWDSAEKAANVCNSMPKRYNDCGFQPMVINNNDQCVDILNTPKELSCNVTDKITEIKNYVTELEQRKIYLCTQLSTADKKIVDLEHLAELCSNLNVSEGYEIYRNLRDVTRERRIIKNEMEMIQYALNSLSITKMEKAKNSIEKMDSKKYTPRELDELFKKYSTKLN